MVERSSYSRVSTRLSREEQKTGTLLDKWEELNAQRLGASKTAARVLLAVLCLVALGILLTIFSWLFGSSGATGGTSPVLPPDIDVTPLSQTSNSPNAHGTPTRFDEPSQNQFQSTSTSTVISSRIGPDGKMVTETTTETMGTDADGKTHATRETKKGEGANGDAEKMMAQMQKAMGGFGLGGLGLGGGFGGLLDGMFGQPEPNPIDQLAHLGFGGGWGQHQPAHQVLRMRDIMRDFNRQPQFIRARPQHHDHGMNIGQLLNQIMNPQPEVQVRVMEIPTMLRGVPLQTHQHDHSQNDKAPDCGARSDSQRSGSSVS